MKNNFYSFLKHTLKLEGGYVDDPDDSGGETNYGITRKVYEEYCLKEKGIRVPFNFSMRDIPTEDVEDIYRKYYWDKVKGDDLPAGIDFMIADMAVNSGVSRAAKTLQQVVNVEQDGFIGPVTLAKLQGFDTKHLLHETFMKRREHYYNISTIRNNKKFLLGWYNRLNDVYTTSHKLIY